MEENNILNKLNNISDIKKLNENELEILSKDIRKLLVRTTALTGGHLSSSLGVVELTIALFKNFDLSKDKVVWDVGHQAYAHKILSGRRESFSTLRQKDGICGFPKQSESPYDAFIAGHSSTSISAALGIAKANIINKNKNVTIAVIGDGALSGGMAYEGLNNAGRHKGNFIVILNDNEMSISKNVGSMAKYLAVVRSTPEYFKTKDFVHATLEKIPFIGKNLTSRIKNSKKLLKEALYNSTFFEDMGFTYLGPIDGHNIQQLNDVLTRAKEIDSPVFIHVQTKKGKGYKFAEQNPDLFHGVSKFDIKTGTQNSKESFSDKFGEALTNLAKKDDKICAITAAMTQGTGLVPFYTLFPDRFFDVSIAEQHAVTFAAGLASCGIKPVFAVYSTFLQRGYDQIIHDCAIEKQHVVFAVDRAGIVGEDGETHQGLFDVSYLSSIPGVVIYSPSNFKELEISLKKALYEEKGVVALRYPRGGEISSEIHCESCTFSLTQNDNNNDILIISYGRIISFVYDAVSTLKSENINIDLLKLVKIHPIDNEIIKLCLKYKKIFFVEESIKNGSVGEHLLSSLAENNFSGNFYHNSVDNIFISHQSTFQAINQCGFDTQGIINFVKKGI